ncbi:DUF1289 domain-containing protein [Vibrio mangrovi]|uniref:DUF1289 domain-containing protein n=1 Tax=Vibrio mangrovi TaxID=474394 RepID=A0A1Y6IMW4_9VIBR|nr:DUF1289 domain-containing protein [Vibrio mangrovi]MDW6004198.1 DUF1289 domain-containing protein [Vibrio mangrovi]SMR99004.1 hypothetical protein VIM7927_00226 [Vibrio mangrovi]
MAKEAIQTLNIYSIGEYHPSSGCKSPCIRHCCLDDHNICVGCFRTLSEILNWHTYTEAQKSVIVSRCETQKKNHLHAVFSDEATSYHERARMKRS